MRVPEGQGGGTVPEQLPQGVVTTRPAAAIPQRPGHRPGQSHGPVNLGQERDTPVAGDGTAGKICLDFTAFDGWKFKRSLVAFCHGGSSCFEGVSNPIFKVSPPFFYPLSRNIRARIENLLEPRLGLDDLA